MAEPASFVPRSFLEHPDDFGVDVDVSWRLASSLDEALRLSRAIDQHHLAVSMGRMLRRRRHSMTDLAVAIGERPETVAAKLRGRRPAPERDLVLWSWMTGWPRTHPPLAELVVSPDSEDASALLPRLDLPARLRRGSEPSEQ